MRAEKLKSAVEAALFMANEPVSIDDLAKMFKTDAAQMKEVIEEFKKDFENPKRGVYLLEMEKGYQIRVKPEYAPLVRTLTPYRELGRGLLRVLALIAYKQPITQAEVVKVIGNRTYEYVKRLEERGLIKTVKHSRTKALIATKEFANYFGLEKPEDIKKFFEEMTKETKE
jgi:segregation and condensation protein B